MVKKILVAYDGSDLSKQALEEARRQALEGLVEEVHIVSVVASTGPATNAKVSISIGSELAKQYEKEMEKIKTELQEDSIQTLSDILISDGTKNPGTLISEYAKNKEMDMIIIGNRGLGNVKKLLLGSVSNNVVQHAPCPVLVMK